MSKLLEEDIRRQLCTHVQTESNCATFAHISDARMIYGAWSLCQREQHALNGDMTYGVDQRKCRWMLKGGCRPHLELCRTQQGGCSPPSLCAQPQRSAPRGLPLPGPLHRLKRTSGTHHHTLACMQACRAVAAQHHQSALARYCGDCVICPSIKKGLRAFGQADCPMIQNSLAPSAGNVDCPDLLQQTCAAPPHQPCHGRSQEGGRAGPCLMQIFLSSVLTVTPLAPSHPLSHASPNKGSRWTWGALTYNDRAVVGLLSF